MNKKKRPSHRSFSGSMLPPETEAAHFIIFALKVFKEVVKGTTAGHAFFLFVINLCRKWASFSVLVRQASKQANAILLMDLEDTSTKKEILTASSSLVRMTRLLAGFMLAKQLNLFFSHLPIKRKHERRPDFYFTTCSILETERFGGPNSGWQICF